MTDKRFKFRIWDKTRKLMLTQCNGYFIELDGTVWRNDGYIEDDLTEIADEVIIMQSTGIEDKNAVLIYEGDIMSIPFHYEGDSAIKDSIAVVRWDAPDFGLYNEKEEKCGNWRYAYFDLWDCATNYGATVIGNICEHKHLLGKEG